MAESSSLIFTTLFGKYANSDESASTPALSKGGGNLAGAGALAFNFKRKGQFLIAKDKIDEDAITELALENDAEDIITESDHYEIVCETAQYDSLADALDKARVEADSSELAYLPNNVVKISDEDSAKKVLKLVESLEDLEDVKAVHGNYDMDEALIEAISG